MGFLDKAKKLAEQAQTKLDEVQKDFNAKQQPGSQPGADAPTVEYDAHGRPVEQAPPAPADKSATFEEAPADKSATFAAPEAPAETPAPPEPAPEQAQGDPLADEAPSRKEPPSAPGMTSGDPLAG